MLKKLEIIAYKDENFSSKAGHSFSVMLNPNSYKRNFKINYSEDKGEAGKSANTLRFNTYASETLSLDFYLDTTGVIEGSDKSLTDLVDQLLDVVYNYDGDIHEPCFIQIVWGTLLFCGRLDNCDIDYTLFQSDGVPLRAKVNLSVRSTISEAKEAKVANRQSPDLTHIVIVKEGDTLPLLCYRIYNDSSYYLKVAQVNNLLNFRNLTPGLRLIFPPLK